MRIGIGKKITSLFGLKYELLLFDYRNRNPRAIKFQEAFLKDIKTDEFYYSFNHLKKLDFPNNLFIKKILLLVKAIFKEEDSEENLILLLEKHQEYNIKLTNGQWLELSMYFLSMGLFESAYKSRQISYKFFKSLKNRIVYQLNFNKLILALLFDSCDINFFKAKLKNTSKTDFWKKLFYDFKDSKQSLVDSEFKNLIHNKRIAIIGPLEFNRDYSSEIEKYDVIIELNGLKSKRDNIVKKYHGFPDIIYYNNSQLEEQNKIDFGDVIDSAKFVVIKNEKYYHKLIKKCKTRVMPSTTMLNWNGSFSMMENVVADLLLFKPKEIKIYGVNLYTSFNYDKSYGNEPPDNLKTITLNFTVHDIFSQYSFMHNLYNLGLINGDDVFEEVLKLGLLEYSRKMKKTYPIFLLNH